MKKNRIQKILRASQGPIDAEKLKKLLMGRASRTLEDLAEKLKRTPGEVLDQILELRAMGSSVVELRPGEWMIHKNPPQVTESKLHTLESDSNGHYRFGVISDTHYGSKYAREDVCDDLYNWFAENGIARVYHCGNWIDGVTHFNQFDLLPEAHGMQAQLDYFAAKYPQRKGIETHYVAGDDHEGWFSQREGVDIGRMLEDTARHAGRSDLRYLGYKEAFIKLRHKKSGELSRLLVDHPGGGSAYADSYAAQKRVEALQSGEKPGMWLFGHWHKSGFFRPREVFVLLAGCTKDLDPFGRKKGLRYDIGGWIVELQQDPSGALRECAPRLRAYYDRGYHEGTAYSMSGEIKR